jgi:hypothetical protein
MGERTLSRGRLPVRRLLLPVVMATVCHPTLGASQQVPDRGFDPVIDVATFASGAGPEVGIDAAHVNRFTLNVLRWLSDGAR